MLYLGIIGYPLSHSISPRIHNAVMEYLRIQGRYLAFEVKPSELKDAIFGAKALGFTGLNVTIPYKEEVLKFVKPVGEAKLAVNTIDLRKMEGYNTDIYGVEMAFKNSKLEVEGKIALVVGAGGAGKAIALALMKMGAKVVLTNRTESRGLEAVRELREYGECIFYPMEKIGELKIDIVANATPVGMKGFSSGIPVPEEILKPGMIVFDAVYNPVETPLIKKAKEIECRVVSGLEMLVYQAEKAFEIWTGIKPPVSLMKKVALEALNFQEK
ncbi:MAG: shikimate dehydrogenase [Archaeoglobaceae archaeon]|nr:shikimate dehydrogenase [Archaeoglobaceae archaeon]